jgi:hypothetical protein
MNNPTVRIINAQDRNLRIGLIKMLTNPRITAITANASQAAVPLIDMRL